MNFQLNINQPPYYLRKSSHYSQRFNCVRLIVSTHLRRKFCILQIATLTLLRYLNIQSRRSYYVALTLLPSFDSLYTGSNKSDLTC